MISIILKVEIFVQSPRFRVQSSMLDVGCSMFCPAAALGLLRRHPPSPEATADKPDLIRARCANIQHPTLNNEVKK
jgi:hypothetical protein